MGNEIAQWLVIFLLIMVQLVAFLTNLDEKWNILRPRYYHPPEEPKPQPRRQGGRKRGTR